MADDKDRIKWVGQQGMETPQMRENAVSIIIVLRRSESIEGLEKTVDSCSMLEGVERIDIFANEDYQKSAPWKV